MADATCVIGAGFSGLAAARALRQRGLPFTCVDRSTAIGGLWHYSEDADASPAYRSLHLNTSRKVTSFTDFPMPETYPRYPRHDQVAAYLREFAEHYGLLEHMELGTEVLTVQRRPDGGWDVTTRDRATGEERCRRFANVVVATGHHWSPRLPEPAIPGADTFPGVQIHSSAYRDPSPYIGKRVLVLGIGNSACDISVELSRIADRTLLAMRRGAHVVPKQMMGIPIDEIATKWWWARMPFRVQRRFIEVLLRIIRGRITDYGIPEPDHRIFSAPVTISDELLSRISHGDILVRPMMERFEGATAHFTDGTSDEIDAVIYCTGYRIEFPFLPSDHVFAPDGRVALYRRVVPVNHPGLYFVGLIRPVGSITRLVEAQSEWVTDLIEGVAGLPSAEEMQREMDAHLRATAARYGTGAMDSIQIDFLVYLKAIAEEREAGRRRAPARRPSMAPTTA